MAEYQDRLLDHDADGIQEYDNPLPGWLMAILWGSMIFSALYIAFFALAFAPASYESQFRGWYLDHRADMQAYFDANPLVPPSAEELLAGATNEATLAVGRDRFAKTCASCHGENAQGLIGPNLTDDYWIHGGAVVKVFNTIVKGVPAKGMPPWGRALSPEELGGLSSYIRSLRGSNPPEPKAPEGNKEAAEPLP
jgi:cytochrome c oxidase cbb3-type subunit 3